MITYLSESIKTLFTEYMIGCTSDLGPEIHKHVLGFRKCTSTSGYTTAKPFLALLEKN
jgi:hypothetical protein